MAPTMINQIQCMARVCPAAPGPKQRALDRWWAANALAPDRPVLDVLPVQDHEQDGAEEGEEETRRRPEEEPRDDAADQRPADPNRGRHPDRHRIRTGDREPREAADDEAPDQDRDDEAERHDVPAGSAASSSRRRSLISSRSFAAYSKRSSSAAVNISSSSVITSLSSSSVLIPSTLRPSRRLRPGTVGDSSERNSAMSETPFWIDSGVIPCSSL